MLKKYKDFILIVNFIIVIVSLFLFPNNIKGQILTSLNVFFKVLFPTFFPMFLFTNLLIEYNAVIIFGKFIKSFIEKVFHVSANCGYVILISLISGFPSGAKNIMMLLDKNLISVEEANYLLTFTHFSNPLFILNVVYLVVLDKSICIKILLAHFVSNFIIALLIRPHKKVDSISFDFKYKNSSFSNALRTSLKNTFDILSIIMGTTIFSFIISGIITNYIHLNTFFKIFINGLFDLTLGINTLKNISIPIISKSILILSFICFGSISVHLQISSIIDNKRVKYKNFLLGRIASIGIALLLFLVMKN